MTVADETPAAAMTGRLVGTARGRPSLKYRRLMGNRPVTPGGLR